MTEQVIEVLRRHTNHHGLALATESTLIRELAVTRDELRVGLRALESMGSITVLSPLPFLVAKFHSSWSASTCAFIENEQRIRLSAPAPLRGPVSSSSYSSKAAAVKQQEDGGAGEGETLLDEVLAVLGPDADRDEFRGVLAGRNPSLVHRALKRVQATQAIRVSRAALFRSLLDKLSP